MKKEDFPSCKKLQEQMKEVQTGKRFQHTLGVSFTAAALAMRYGYDVKKAQLAGLLHDCAKCLPDEKLLALCREHNLPCSEVEERLPYLLHGKVGAFLAKNQYGIDDEEICHAISCHTTGCPEMSLLDKILFLADYIEPERKQIPNLDEIRMVVFRDLDEGLMLVLSNMLSYLKQTGQEVDTTTQLTYDYYRNMQK